MIKITNTENLTGVSISGDYDDLENLVEAFHTIAVDEFYQKYERYIDMSTRVLGVCYDIRHAMQGDREIEVVDNGMNSEKMKWHATIVPTSNVYYKCNYLYPEMFFVMLALNELVLLRIQDLAKVKNVSNESLDKNVIWDDTIATIRLFQAEFVKCVKEVLADGAFKRWINLMNSKYIDIAGVAGQFIDLQNIKYINMTREKRIKNLGIIGKRIVEYYSDPDHEEIKEIVTEAAKKYRCSAEDIRLEGIEYPDGFEW